MTIIGALSSCQENSDHKKLETVAAFGNSMAIGLSVNADNRIFVSFPDADGNGNLALAEVVDGDLEAYPDSTWNTKGTYSDHFLRVQDIYVDKEGYLWVLDSRPGSAGNIFGDGKGGSEGLFKLVKINTNTNEVEDTFLFEDLDKTKSALNDVRIDTDKKIAYLSDPGLAAIVILDLQTKKSRSSLNETSFTLADDITLEYNGIKMQDKNGKPFSSNVNSIALTKDLKYLYFKPINKRNLYRIPTAYLADTLLPEAELSHKVEDMGEVGITHGMIADDKGNIYFASSEKFNISYLTPAGKLKVLVEDPRLIWPDSFGIGADGNLYFTCAQLQRSAQWNNGQDRTEYPFKAFKVSLR